MIAWFSSLFEDLSENSGLWLGILATVLALYSSLQEFATLRVRSLRTLRRPSTWEQQKLRFFDFLAIKLGEGKHSISLLIASILVLALIANNCSDNRKEEKLAMRFTQLNRSSSFILRKNRSIADAQNQTLESLQRESKKISNNLWLTRSLLDSSKRTLGMQRDFAFELIESRLWPCMSLKITDVDKSDLFLFEFRISNFDEKYHVHNAKIMVDSIKFVVEPWVTPYPAEYQNLLKKLKNRPSPTSYNFLKDLKPLSHNRIAQTIRSQNDSEHVFRVSAIFPAGFYSYFLKFRIENDVPQIIRENEANNMDHDHWQFLEDVEITFRKKKYRYVEESMLEEIDKTSGKLKYIGDSISTNRFLYREGKLLHFISPKILVHGPTGKRFILKKGIPVELN